ncbi:fibronectin type III domain-containing protein [bacterium RCC_150]
MRLLRTLFRHQTKRHYAWRRKEFDNRSVWFRWGGLASVLLLVGYSVVAIGLPARAAVPKTVISLTFDDGNDDQLAAEQVLKSHGLVGTFFITTSWIDSPSWLTRANLNTIAADGNEIGGHTVTHPDLTTLSTSAATAEVCNGRTTLASWGFNATDFAYPFAAENSSVEQIVKNCGFASARNLGDIRSPASCSGCPFAETLPPANPYNTAAPDEVDSTWTLQNLEDLVTNAEPGGGWVQFTFHHIAVGTDPTLTISPSLFSTFITWLAGRTANGTTSVQTVAQALAGGATPPPTATAPAAPTGVTATAGNGSATVSWTAPGNGGSAITSYAVTPHAGTTTLAPTTVTGNPPATTANITGLTNGTAYTFTVTATNAIGTSPPSTASAAVTPTATTPPPPPPGTSIANGGFESGLTSWTTGGVRAPVANTAVHHSGTGSALLGLASGTEPLGDSSLSQTITVPATGTSTLTFWYQPHTNDDTCNTTTCKYDWMEAQVRNTSGTTLASLFKLSSNSGAWTQVTANLSAYQGQTVTLWFNVHLDGASPADDTWMYLDDVTLSNTQTTATAPAAPTGVTATAGNGSATVSWTAPGNGGSAITSYAVTPHAGTTTLAPTTVTGNPPATTANITGLTNGTAYTFTVTATNAIGTSPPSTASAAVTPTATTPPPPPPGTSIANGGFESGLTSWTTGGVRAPVANTAVHHSGTGSALLGLASGTEPLGDSSLSQTITVPATGTSTLTFWYQPHTNDDTCNTTTCKYDWMEAQVRNTSGTTLASLFKLSSDSGTWTQRTADLSAYKGQTITIWFNVHLDGASPADDTWMYLDDVTLTTQ